MIRRTHMNAFTHCFIKNFTKSCKSCNTFLKIYTFTYSIFGQMGFRKTHLWRQKNIFATFYCLCCAAWWYKRHCKIHYSFHTWIKNKVITNPNLSKFYSRQRDWKKLHPDFARILILVNQPGLNELSFKMTMLNGLIIYQFFRPVHTESK